MSFLQRIGADAKNACSDLYGSYVLGDDAGKSMTFALVLKPSSLPVRSKGIARIDLGMTFLEINGRAYVKSVAPGSVAAMGGVQPQDAVQYATLLRPEWVASPGPSRRNPSLVDDDDDDGDEDDDNDGEEDEHEEGNGPRRRRKGGIAGGDRILPTDDANDGDHDNSSSSNDDETALLKRAQQHVMDLEDKGARISYDELRRLLAEAMDPTQSAFLSPPTAAASRGYRGAASSGAGSGAGGWNGPPIPSTVNICVPVRIEDEDDYDGGGSNNNSNSNNQGGGSQRNRQWPNSPYSREMPRPVIFVFRRTRQRKALHHLGLPGFRLDDECDLATSLVKRLAPTADMEIPPPDTWEELVHDGTDWLLGRGSMLPPKNGAAATSANNNSNNSLSGETNPLLDLQQQQQQPPPLMTTTNDDENDRMGGGQVPWGASAQHDGMAANGGVAGGGGAGDDDDHDPAGIPLDEYESIRARKLAQLRSRMAAEAMQVGDRSEDVEAVTIRGMIQKAVGLAFVRASKVVLGVSLHCGSGIVLARLSDGTWSAPSAIGTWGAGFGIQFGLEVAEYIFILQTQEALEHFKRGGSFTVGGNMGVAVAGVGREAYGAASVGGGCGSTSTVNDDEYNDNDSRVDRDNPPQSVAIAPIVAYAKSQGLYVGVSLEGSRIYARDDINRRTYKFLSGRDVSAADILNGKVPTPREAEDLYAALHSVEFTHEMSCLPRPPEVLRKDSSNAWYYDKPFLTEQVSQSSSGSASEAPPATQRGPFAFLASLSPEEAEDCEAFETQFKNFMYGGVSVQRLLPDSEGSAGRTGKERRTLWLMLPEVGSLRLGFVSKLSDGEGAVSNKSSTQRARRDDTSRYDGDVGTVGSEDVTLDSALNTRDGSTIGHVRTGNVQLSSRHSVALTDVIVLSQEPLVPVRFKGEDKMEHLRVISIQDVAGTSLLFLANNFREAELLVCGLKLLLERESTRLGVRGGLPLSAFGAQSQEGAMSPSAARGYREVAGAPRVSQHRRERSSGNVSVDLDHESLQDGSLTNTLDKSLPDSRRTWGNVPGRDYMRGQAATVSNANGSGFNEHGVPHYVYGQQVVRDVARNVRLPLPLPLCRVLLLDSTSPVMRKWESNRGDKNFDKSRWVFPPATPRELERHSSEHQLIASGSMCGATRMTSFDRPRYGSTVRLSETHTVDADDRKKLVVTIEEKNPRRGFIARVKIVLRAVKEDACDASIVAEVRPVGKDMSNQAAVHKAFLLVLDEIKLRYGSDGCGLLAGFMKVVDNMAEGSSRSGNSPVRARDGSQRQSQRTGSAPEEKKADSSAPGGTKKDSKYTKSGLVSFADMLSTGRQSPDLAGQENRPSTPSVAQLLPAETAKRRGRGADPPEVTHDDGLQSFAVDTEPRLIEVKPLPKIRLSLMPSPREEDEEDLSSTSGAADTPRSAKDGKKKKMSPFRGKKQSSAKSPSGKMSSRFKS